MQQEWQGIVVPRIPVIPDFNDDDENYCCPVKLKKTKSSYSKPFIIGLRCFIFKK